MNPIEYDQIISQFHQNLHNQSRPLSHADLYAYINLIRRYATEHPSICKNIWNEDMEIDKQLVLYLPCVQGLR